MFQSVGWLTLVVLVLGGALVPSCLCDMCDRRDKRDRRDSMTWKGDVGDLETFPGGVVKDRLKPQPHRRIRRFLSFPTGSMLSITPTLTIPFINEVGGYITGDQVYKFPIDLVLPNATLRLSKFNSDENYDYYGYGNTYGNSYGNMYDNSNSNMYDNSNSMYDNSNTNMSDNPQSSGGGGGGGGTGGGTQYQRWWWEEAKDVVGGEQEEESSYSVGYDQLHYNNPHHHYWNHKKRRRALDDQRVKGFGVLEQLLENLGLDGHECLLRAVCEIGEEPIADLGITGEIINLFFSAGYGGRVEELMDYIMAEESGREGGDCEFVYQGCPYNLVALAQSALAYFHHGLAHVGDLNSNTLVS